MSKRPPAAASKHGRNAKITGKAPRPKAAVLRSSKLSARRVGETGASELRPNAPNTSEEAALRPEIPAAEAQIAPRKENPAAALQDRANHRMTHATSGGLQFSAATANMQSYQARLLDISLAHIQFAFELAHRLATIKSPLDAFQVTAEFTGKRIALFQEQVYQTAS
jgi:hypothetical protein